MEYPCGCVCGLKHVERDKRGMAVGCTALVLPLETSGKVFFILKCAQI